jgi:chorismate mutase/prephenate dehydratase
LKGAAREAVSSTSRAAELAASQPNTAAVCNSVCAEMYGLQIIASNIEDMKSNGYELRDLEMNISLYYGF